MDDGF
jgi:DNA replication licensing factor MCM2